MVFRSLLVDVHLKSIIMVSNMEFYTNMPLYILMLPSSQWELSTVTLIMALIDVSYTCTYFLRSANSDAPLQLFIVLAVT